MDQNQPGPTPPPGFPPGAGTPAPQYPFPPPIDPPKKDNSTKIVIGVVVGVCLMFCLLCGGMMVAIAIPGFLKAREQSRLNACMQNQMMIDGATQQWGLQTKAAPGQAPTWDDLLKGGMLPSMPVCPSGGTYTLGAVADEDGTEHLPTCSHPGHDLAAYYE